MRTIATFLVALSCALVVPASAQVPKEHSLLWEIKAPGQAKRSYLFGTIHLICPADFMLGDSVRSAFQKSEQLALEVDLDDPGLAVAMMKGSAMQGSQRLKDLFSEAEYARLAAYYKDSVKMDLSMFARMKPFFLMAPLVGPLLSCNPQSYEMTLVAMAGEKKIEVVGLEDIQEQMAVFDSISYNEQAKMVYKIIDNLPDARNEFLDLIAIYKTENIDDLAQMMAKSEYGMEIDQNVLLLERNQKWIPRIKNMMSTKPTFFAVGAAHLGGEKGLIDLLRKEGYVVAPVFRK